MHKIIDDLLKWIGGEATNGDPPSKPVSIPGISVEDLTPEEIAVYSRLLRLVATRLAPEKMKLLDEATRDGPLRNISIRINEETLDALDKLIGEEYFSSRGHGLRSVFMEFLDPSLSVELRVVESFNVDQGVTSELVKCYNPAFIHRGDNLSMVFGAVDDVSETEAKKENGFLVFEYVDAGKLVVKIYPPDVARAMVEREESEKVSVG